MGSDQSEAGSLAIIHEQYRVSGNACRCRLLPSCLSSSEGCCFVAAMIAPRRPRPGPDSLRRTLLQSRSGSIRAFTFLGRPRVSRSVTFTWSPPFARSSSPSDEPSATVCCSGFAPGSRVHRPGPGCARVARGARRRAECASDRSEAKAPGLDLGIRQRNSCSAASGNQAGWSVLAYSR